MKIYTVDLTPLGSYYLGSENNLADGENYFAKSLRLPQQTTLLGTIRKKLLDYSEFLTADDYKGEKISDPHGAASFIGKEGFSHSHITEDFQYGLIKAIGPLHLVVNNLYYFHAPENDRQITSADKLTHHKEFVPVSDNQTSITFMDIHSETAFTYPSVIPKIEEKDFGDSEYWIGQNSNNDRKKYDDIWEEEFHTGIYKTHRRPVTNETLRNESDDKGYFQKVYWKLKGDVTFRFHLFLQNDIPDDFLTYVKKENLVTMGGERSLFQISIADVTSSGLPSFNFNIFKPSCTGYVKIIFLSPCYLPSKFLSENEIFCIGQTTHLRFLQSKIETENYYEYPSGGKQSTSGIMRSVRLNLLSAGSVLFVKPELLEKVKAKIESFKRYRAIGYNAYVTVDEHATHIYELYKPE